MKKIISLLMAIALTLALVCSFAPALAAGEKGMATITLTVTDSATYDGSGFQMLLDADANEYGDTIPTIGNRFGGGYYGCMDKYARFEYKIPENADGDWMTDDDIVYTGESCTVTIPEGTYDWVIVNPCPYDDSGSVIFVIGDAGNINGRYDDYVFEADKHYTFTISGGNHGNAELTIEDMEDPDPILGDVDGNGVVDINDALLVHRHVLELFQIENEVLADVDRDGRVTGDDVLMIARCALGLISEF